MDQNLALRKHLINLLNGGQAYDTMDEILSGFRARDRSRIPEGAEHSAWQILDHMVRAFDDIVEFSDNAKGKYREKAWPEDYWSKAQNGDWDKSIEAYKSALRKMEKLIKSGDLFAPFPWGSGQTLLREALLAADHQAHHLGQMIELQRWLAKK